MTVKARLIEQALGGSHAQVGGGLPLAHDVTLADTRFLEDLVGVPARVLDREIGIGHNPFGKVVGDSGEVTIHRLGSLSMSQSDSCSPARLRISPRVRHSTSCTPVTLIPSSRSIRTIVFKTASESQSLSSSMRFSGLSVPGGISQSFFIITKKLGASHKSLRDGKRLLSRIRGSICVNF